MKSESVKKRRLGLNNTGVRAKGNAKRNVKELKSRIERLKAVKAYLLFLLLKFNTSFEDVSLGMEIG